MNTPSSSDLRQQQAVTLDILRQLCAGVPTSMVLSGVLGALVCFALYDVVATSSLLSWIGIVLASHGLRLYWLKLDRAAIAGAAAIDVSLDRMRGSILVGGLAWGSIGWLLFPSESLSHQLYLVFAMAGLTAGASVSYSIDPRCALGFVFPVTLIYMARMLIEADAIHISMAFGMLLYLAFVILNIRRLNKHLLENIRLRIQAADHNTQSEIIQAQLTATVERFKSLTELSSDWYWEQDENYRFVDFASQTDHNAGLPNSRMYGKTRWELGSLNMTTADWDKHKATVEAHESFYDLELHRHDEMGRDVWVAISGRPILDANGKFLGYRGIGRTITERKLAQAESQRLSLYDSLTGLPNRQHLINRLSQAVAASSRNKALGALIFIDLDHFKQVNDNYGHQAGDQLLQEVGRRLPACLRENDTVARIGGDEFVVLLEGLGSNTLESARQAEALSEKLLAQLNKPYVLGSQQYTCTPSIGMVLLDPDKKETALQLMQNADSAMYQAKDAGRNTARFFDPELQSALNQHAVLEFEMRRGIQQGQFVLHYQAQLDSTRTITGVEALIRWSHPQQGMIPPGQFIPLAESTDLILPLGNWVIETACRQLVNWAASESTSALTISVNVSARQLRQFNFVDQVLAIVQATGANPRRLKIEITESLLLDNVENTIAKMTQLKHRGIGFSLDDFGTGYSSLSYLKRLPLDQLKIDQSFVREVLTDPSDATIVKTIISLGQNMGMAVIAEGVETQGQLDFLTSHGCTAYQGYLFGRPAPVQELKLN